MMRPALFLDRDGVVNRERGEHTWRLEDLVLLPDVGAAVRAANDAGWAVIVITNQSGIALGLYTHQDVHRIHTELERRLALERARIDAFHYCPHHPDHGRCLCRKPGSLLLEKALARHGIDPARSWMIGDRERDIIAARDAGVRGRLIPSNAPLFPLVQELLQSA